MRIKKEMQRTAERQSVPHDIRAASLSDIRIAQRMENVKYEAARSSKKRISDRNGSMRERREGSRENASRLRRGECA